MQNEFSVKDSQVAKGIAVFLMFIHHLFSSDGYWMGYELHFGIIGTERMMKIASFSKICVAIFIFITVYGITIKFKQKVKNNADRIKLITAKYITLLITFLFIFMITQLIWLTLGKGTNLNFYGNGLKGFFGFLLDASGISYFYSGDVLNVTWWYMSVLFALLVMLPLLWKMKECLGGLLLAAMILLPRALGTLGGPLIEYLPVIGLGMLAADKNWIEQIGHIGNKYIFTKIIKWIIYIGIMYGCFVLRNTSDYDMLVDAIAALVVVLFVNEVIGKIPIVKDILYYFGRHSFEIFLTHSLFVIYFFNDHLFRLKNGFLILGVLALASLVLAIIIKGLEKLCGIERLKKHIFKKFEIV